MTIPIDIPEIGSPGCTCRMDGNHGVNSAGCRFHSINKIISEGRKSRRYIVELQPGCWLADWDGDPGRTLQLGNAKQFISRLEAGSALDDAREYHPFLGARIIDQVSLSVAAEPEPAAASKDSGQAPNTS